MDDGNPDSGERHVHCPYCGDLAVASARRCPHCGAGISVGSQVVNAGVMILRVIMALLIGLLVLPLGAFGACMVVSGTGMTFSGQAAAGSIVWILVGLLSLALAIGGVRVIMALFTPGRRGPR